MEFGSVAPRVEHFLPVPLDIGYCLEVSLGLSKPLLCALQAFVSLTARSLASSFAECER